MIRPHTTLSLSVVVISQYDSFPFAPSIVSSLSLSCFGLFLCTPLGNAIFNPTGITPVLPQRGYANIAIISVRSSPPVVPPMGDCDGLTSLLPGQICQH